MTRTRLLILAGIIAAALGITIVVGVMADAGINSTLVVILSAALVAVGAAAARTGRE